MRKYVFYDTDFYGTEERDIRGEEYEKLIRICCKYSSVLCLKYLDVSVQAYSNLMDFEITKPENILIGTSNDRGCFEKRYYKVCPQLCAALLNVADGMFEWLNGWGFKNPENPIFYRSDGTIFFMSEIHDGVCAIMPREDEDIDEVLYAIKWCTGDDIRSWPPV